MISYSIIQKSQLEGAMRLDAEYYQPEYFIDFTKGKWDSIGNILTKCQYGLSLAMNDEKEGFPMFKMDDILDAFLVDGGVRYADVSENDRKNFKIEKDDIFFNRVNSEEFVGRTGIFKLEREAVFASYLIRLQADSSRILPDYLNIFLNSKLGLKQIRRYARRAVNQANVNAEELKQFKIALLPKNFQEEIVRLSNDAWKNFEQSKILYQQAEDLLLKEVGLENFDVGKESFSIVNLSDVRLAGRIDAEYYQPKYGILESKLRGYHSKPFGEVIENIPATFDPSSNPATDYRYVELSNINSSLGIIDGFSEVSGKEAPSRAKRVLKAGDVIVSSVEGSLGKVALVSGEQNGYIASTGFFQLRSKVITPEVILVIAKSLVLQMQLKKRAAGTILSAVPKESLKKIIIPILPQEIQKKISDLVTQSHVARKKSKALLDEAKQKVEEKIEKGS